MSKNEKIRRAGIASCGRACEHALRQEQAHLHQGYLEEAAYWADRAEQWSRSAFEWACMELRA